MRIATVLLSVVTLETVCQSSTAMGVRAMANNEVSYRQL